MTSYSEDSPDRLFDGASDRSLRLGKKYGCRGQDMPLSITSTAYMQGFDSHRGCMVSGAVEKNSHAYFGQPAASRDSEARGPSVRHILDDARAEARRDVSGAKNWIETRVLDPLQSMLRGGQSDKFAGGASDLALRLQIADRSN